MPPPSSPVPAARAPVRTGRLAGAGLRPPPAASVPAPADADAPAATAAPTVAAPRATPRRIPPVPPELLTDAALQADIAALPGNYSFEIPKTVHRVRASGAARVALQMPDGLLMYAAAISDILLRHTCAVDTVVLADVTYGACCVDDLSARALRCDLLVHYGHSCLVPVHRTVVPALYVFVHIAFDTAHLKACLLRNFPRDTRLGLVATIQFVDTAHQLRDDVAHHFASVAVPQKRPLSPAELLGCTSPTIRDVDVLVYLGDGRFHLESAMIANPHLRAYRYDPYAKLLTDENYAHAEMRALRRAAVEQARTAHRFGVILGTLGRQGSPALMHRVLAALRDARKSYFVVLLSEISPAKIATLEQTGVQAWVQIACPRLSIDWGAGFGNRPLLTTYEAFVALGKTQWRDVYPMDFYAKDGGEWSNYWKREKDKPRQRKPRPVTAS